MGVLWTIIKTQLYRIEETLNRERKEKTSDYGVHPKDRKIQP